MGFAWECWRTADPQRSRVKRLLRSATPRSVRVSMRCFAGLATPWRSWLERGRFETRTRQKHVLRSGLRWLLIPIALLLISCAPAPPAPPRIRFEYRIYEKALPGCQEDGKPDCATVRIEYPEFTVAPTEAVRAKLNAAVEEAILAPFDEGIPKATSPDHLARLFFETFESGAGASWFLRRTLTVELASAKAVMITGLEQVYTGRGEPRETRTRLDLHPE